ncbi:MAG TPA: hypothetical protein VMS73_07150 [Anaerolineaceae bacterium]|nr:hypothetical protein [Anaerolineaceae bacterium]
MNSFKSNEITGTVVFQSISLNLSIVVCDQLEKAGYPANLEKVDSGFAVLVPPEKAAESRWLITGHPKKREILV